MTTLPLANKVAFVGGAGGDIGHAISVGLAEAGATVLLTSRAIAKLSHTRDVIERLGAKAQVYSVDLEDPLAVKSCADKIRRDVGEVDILVNNAGGRVHSELRPLSEMTHENWWRVVEANIKPPAICAREFLPAMTGRGWGRILNIASTAGKIGIAQLSAYSAAKHGVIGLTRSLALEVATKGVTVNALCLGYVRSEASARASVELALALGVDPAAGERLRIDQIPQKRAIDPSEIVPAVLFLVSEAAARTTGEALNVSGGRVMH